jgi:hypothetical protein
MFARFVGYIIRFIHNRDKVELGILLGYACSKMGFAMPPERVDEIKAYRYGIVGTEPTRGFLLSAANIMDSKLTLGGTGTMLCFLSFVINNNLCVGDIKWEVKRRHHKMVLGNAVPGLMAALRAHCAQSRVRCADLAQVSLVCLTAKIHLNGQEWEEGVACRYRLPGDAASRTLLGRAANWRIGVVVNMVVVPALNAPDFLMVSVRESYIHNREHTLDIVDVVRAPLRHSLLHLSHVDSLVIYVPYWDTRATNLKVVLKVASTR